MGNRLSKAVSGGSTTSYAYDSMNRISTATGMGFTWDDNGNLLTWDDGVDDWTYRYDSEDRLINVKKNSGLSAVYTYDADGRRVESVDGGGVTDYVYSGLSVIDEVSGGVHDKHYYAGGLHVASNSSGTVEYYHQDHLGSTRLKTNSTGGVVYESNYEPYGPGSGEMGSEEYRYTGKHEDPIGLYYFGARYYDPLTGRFTTRDTVFGSLGDPQSQNRYAYCENNPHKYTDPDGHSHGTDGNPLSGGVGGFAAFWELNYAELASAQANTYDYSIYRSAGYLPSEIGYGFGVEGSYTWGELVDDFYGGSPIINNNHIRHSNEFAVDLGYDDLFLNFDLNTMENWEKYSMWEAGAETFFKDGLYNLELNEGYNLFYDTRQKSLNMVYRGSYMSPYRFEPDGISEGRGYVSTMYNIISSYRSYIRDGRYLYITGNLP